MMRNLEKAFDIACEQYNEFGVDVNKALETLSKVAIVFAGHEHFYTRCTDPNGVKHITTGGGGASLDVPSMDYPYVEVIAGVNHYCAIDIAGNTLDFKAVGSDGTVLDTFTIVHE